MNHIYDLGLCIQQWNPNPEAPDEWRYRDEYFKTRKGEIEPKPYENVYVAPLESVIAHA